jgi:hypothetical protein
MAEDPASSKTLRVETVPGNLKICLTSDRLHLGTAAWMAWFSANSYAHLNALAPALEKNGYGNAGDGALWIREFENLKGARERKTRDAAERERALIQTVHPARKIEFFSGGRVVSDNGKVVFEKGSTQVTWVEHRTLRYAVVSFRGTESDDDVMADINIARSPGPSGGRVHQGFSTALSEVEPLIDSRMSLLAAGTRLYVTGHSLGGALANIFLARALDRRPDLRYALYTFGSPRVGNQDFAALLESKAADAKTPLLRFHNGADPVATKPPAFFGWEHAGTPIHLEHDRVQVDGDFNLPLLGTLPDHAITNYFDRVARRAAMQDPRYPVFGEESYRGETAASLSACPAPNP